MNNLHKNDKIHGNINPLYLGISKEANQYLLLDDLKNKSVDFEKTQINNLSDEKDLFLSPELYYKLEGKKRDQEVDGKKNDLYSLGASLLQLGIKKPLNDCYESKGQFNSDILNRNLCEFDKKFKNTNPMLSKLVWNLTEPDPEKRPDGE